MTWRELTAQLDRELGVPEDKIADTMKLADELIPEAKAALDKEIPEDKIEATRRYMLQLRQAAQGMTLEQIMDETNQIRAKRN